MLGQKFILRQTSKANVGEGGSAIMYIISKHLINQFSTSLHLLFNYYKVPQGTSLPETRDLEGPLPVVERTPSGA